MLTNVHELGEAKFIDPPKLVRLTPRASCLNSVAGNSNFVCLGNYTSSTGPAHGTTLLSLLHSTELLFLGIQTRKSTIAQIPNLKVEHLDVDQGLD